MDAGILLRLLTECINHIEKVNDRIQRIDSLMWGTRSVSCLAVKADLIGVNCQGVHRFRIHMGRMAHHGDIHIVKGTGHLP